MCSIIMMVSEIMISEEVVSIMISEEVSITISEEVVTLEEEVILEEVTSVEMDLEIDYLVLKYNMRFMVAQIRLCCLYFHDS